MIVFQRLKTRVRCAAILILPVLLISGCTIHPDGEQHERTVASQAGHPFAMPPEKRQLPALPQKPTPTDLVRYAWLASPELEQQFWEWKAAIEQIPQDGTQPTNLVVYGNSPITNGSTAFNRTVVTVANDPMADIQWPSKPATAARRALEQARAAGFRFQQAKLDVRQKVLDAYCEYALGAERLRLEQLNAQSLATSADLAAIEIPSGKATPLMLLASKNDAELSINKVGELQSNLISLRAALNAALGRDAQALLAPPDAVPSPRELNCDPADIESLALPHNPALAALDADTAAKRLAVKLATLQYLPDFSLSGSTDLAGITQNLSAMVTVPLLKHEAINASIAQAEATLSASAAARRQTSLDLQSRIVADTTVAADLQKQSALLQTNIIPRAEMASQLTRDEYTAGRVPMSTLLDADRSLTDLKRLAVELTISQDEHLLDLQAAVGRATAR